MDGLNFGFWENYRIDEKFYCYLADDEVLQSVAHFHDRFELIYVAQGECEAVIDGKRYFAEKDDIIFVNGFEIHYYVEQKNIKVLVLVADDEFLNTFYAVYGKKGFSNLLTNRKANAEIFKLLNEWKVSGTENVLNNAGRLNIVLSLLAKSYPPSEKEAGRNDMVGILGYLSANYSENITMSGVAKKFGYSPAIFSTQFNKLTGMNFRKYLNRIRLNAVSRLVSEKKISVAAAAEEAGFSNTVTYYRALKNAAAQKF